MTVPGVFPTTRLAKVYPTRKLVQINAAKAKRSVLHSIGWLAWWATVVVDWEKELTDSVVNQISSLLSSVKSKRGVICDLDRDWQTINIPLYLQNNIPFFYLWDFEARSDQQFSRLNKITHQANRLDHFFQEILAYQSTDEMPILHTYSVFIIDFEGWKR